MAKTKLIESKITAWIAMILVVILIVLSFIAHLPWWAFIAIFFCFIGVFSHLAALYLKRMSLRASGKLETIAAICIALAVLGVIAEHVVSNIFLEEV